jgi:hypothetical protein
MLTEARAPTGQPPIGKAPIVVVTGLPRSGTSMMMRMLESGGLPLLTDHQREADLDNPHGYYEYERVKALDKGDQEWLWRAEGKAVKVISALVKYLPPEHNYQVIFVRRDLEEVLASQHKMLVHLGQPANTSVSDEQLRGLYERHIASTVSWLEAQPSISLLQVKYQQILAQPEEEARQINHFLGNQLDTRGMAVAVDPHLYRNRSSAAG